MAVAKWKVKAFAQRLFSAMPAGHVVNYGFQRTFGGLPIPDDSLDHSVDLAKRHLANLSDDRNRPADQLRIFEFGAGFDLHMPLILAALGVEQLVVLDLRRLVRTALVDDIARRVNERLAGDATHRILEERTGPLDAWLRRVGIDYQAPADPRSTNLEADSITAVMSTNTLEHIPPDDIVAILRECRRLLAPGGLMSFQIDYCDHYHYFDQSISQYNYLTYSPSAWQRYNPSLHFQNRLRHSQHLELIDRAGFDVVDEELIGGGPADIAEVTSLDLRPPFDTMDVGDVAIRSSILVLAPRIAR